jgi:RNA polymerase subunit RPABC4/transcription elongation factor Spt4
MNEDSGIAKFLNDTVLSVLDQIANGNGPKIIGYILVVIVGSLWVYCGLKIYFDAKDRFMASPALKYLFLLFGIVTGPVGLLIYNFTKPRFTPEEMDFIRIEHKFYFHQASKVLDCLKCDAYVLENHAYCTNCGTQNRFKCENCSELSDYDSRYCPSCGSQQPYRMAEFQKRESDKIVEKTTEASAIRNLMVSTKPKAELLAKNVAAATKNLVNQVSGKVQRIRKKGDVKPTKPSSTSDKGKE